MKSKILFSAIFLLFTMQIFAQSFSVPQPFITEIFCNGKNGSVVVKANGQNGIWIGCTLKLLLGMSNRTVDLPAKWVVGEQKVVFQVILAHSYTPGLATQEIVYSYVIAMWEKAVPKNSQSYDINNPSTYYMTGLIPGSWREGVCY
jgi:hypothetical protein